MKAVSIISIVYGSLGLIWAAVAGFVVRMQQAIFEQISFPPEIYDYLDFPALMQVVYDILGSLFPFVYLIGILYITSGILQLNGKETFKALAYAAAIMNIVWYLVYAVLTYTELLPLLEAAELFPVGFMNAMFLVGLMVNAAFYCGYPVFLILYLARGGKEWDTLETGYKS
jgi:hypothetical protein